MVKFYCPDDKKRRKFVEALQYCKKHYKVCCCNSRCKFIQMSSQLGYVEFGVVDEWNVPEE